MGEEIGRRFQAEERACAKALRQECAWHVPEISAEVWPKLRKEGEH